MSKLEYSGDAINTLSKFYRCDTIVYVEGDDDALFWSTVFARCTEVDVVTKSVGGSSELDKFVERIIDEDLKVIAARDADFLTICAKNVSDPRVVYTYGYSIENTLYTDKAICRIAQLWSKGKGGAKDQECRNWLAAFHNEFEKLAAYDAANFLFNCGISVAGDNIARFSKKSSPHEIDGKKVERRLSEIAGAISYEMVDTIRTSEKIANGASIANWIRGHFLASAVIQYVSFQIKEAGLATKITYDGLYAIAIEHLEHHLNIGHPHYSHYEQSARRALAGL